MIIRNVIAPEGSCVNAGELCIQDGRFAGRRPEGSPEIVDGGGLYALPGMIDIHMHGAVGVDVNAADADGYRRVSAFLATQGTTGFLCSILTDTEERTSWCIRQARQAMEETLPGARLLGIHLEGPFLAREYKGAMPEELLREGDIELFRRYQRLAGGAIRYITVSPEAPGATELIRALGRETTAAVGHSGATYDQAMAAVAAGARACTHTFNAMRLFHQHEPAIMGAALESDIYCEAICDGLHLHPASVRLLLKCKGWERVVAVTDSIMAAGLPDGEYRLGVNRVTVRDGDARLTEGGVRAGSTLTQQRALQKVMAFTGADPLRASRLFSRNPAQLLGLSRKGAIAPGMDADLTLVRPDGTVALTVVGGRKVFSAQAAGREAGA